MSQVTPILRRSIRIGVILITDLSTLASAPIVHQIQGTLRSKDLASGVLPPRTKRRKDGWFNKYIVVKKRRKKMKKNEFEKIIERKGYRYNEKVVKKNGLHVIGYELEEDLPFPSNIKPMIYDHQLEDLDEATLIKMIENAFNAMPEINIDELLTPAYIKKNVITCLRYKTDDNTEVTFPAFEDLEEYFRVIISKTETGDIGTTIVTKALLETVGISPRELQLCARDNTRRTVEISSMHDMLLGLGAPVPIDNEDREIMKNQMYVITANNRVNGASAILFRSILNKIAEDAGVKKLTIIPSSIHECIIWTGDMMPNVDTMIQDVNDTQVSPFEVLSNHAYYYDYEEDYI